jgi:hypothetical protein
MNRSLGINKKASEKITGPTFNQKNKWKKHHHRNMRCNAH